MKEEALYNPSVGRPKDQLKHKEKRRLVEEGKISLWLDTYEDLYSSFDSRPYSERALSDDFLQEAKKASKDKPSGELLLRLLMPKKLRSISDEKMIKKRLKKHFERHYYLAKKEVTKKRKFGTVFVALGVVVMFIASLILFKEESKNLWTSFIIIILEPAGWFLFWEGLNQIVLDRKSVV